MKLSKRLVLASGSPRRRALLSEAGYAFDVLPVDVDESPPAGSSPEAAAVAIARRKAVAAAANVNNAMILAADTIVVTPSGEIAGKPADEADARRMLAALSGSTHRVITGVYLLDCDTGASIGRAVATRVVFGPMSPRDIDDYVASGEAMGKAGAYAIQETGDRFVKELDGSLSNVVGLPMEALAEMIKEIESLGAGRRRGG